MISLTLQHIVAVQFNVPFSRVLPGTRFVEDLGADSMDLIELTMEVESQLGLDVPDEVMEGFRCMADVLGYLEVAMTPGRTAGAALA